MNTRLDYSIDDMCGFGLAQDSVASEQHEVVFTFGGETEFPSHGQALEAQCEYERALIRRALKVATYEEARLAGWMPRDSWTALAVENCGLIKLVQSRLGVTCDAIRATVASQAAEYALRDEPRADLRETFRYLAPLMTDEDLAVVGLVRRPAGGAR